MAIQFQTAATAGGNTASLVCNIPTGASTGEVLFAVWGARATCILFPATGWVTVASTNAGGATPSHYLLYLVLGGTIPTSCTFSMSGAGNQAVGIARFSGVNTASVIDSDTQANTGNNTSPVNTAVTTGCANAMLINGIANAAITATITAPSAMTEAWQTATGAIVEQNYLIQVAAGLSNTFRADMATSTRWTDFMTALQPAAASGGTTVVVKTGYLRPMGIVW